MPRYIIYGLIDPRTRLIRYIGKSTSGLQRPRSHTHGKRTGPHCKAWIKQLQLLGLNFEIAVLDSAERDTLTDLECHWIAFGRACGWPLTNLTDGGEGMSGYKHSEETRDRMSRARRDAWARADYRSRVVERARAGQQDPEYRARARARITGDQNPARQTSAREKISEAARKRWADPIEVAKHHNKRPEYRARASARITGDQNPAKRPEVRAKIQAAAIAREARKRR